MNCSEVADLLYLFVDGELSVEQNVVLLKHTELCTRCAGVAARERDLRGLVTQAAAEPTDPTLARSFLSSAIERAEAEAALEAGPRWPRYALAAAALLLALGLGATYTVTAHPCCVKACPTLRLAEAAALAAESGPTVSVDELRASFPRPLFVPKACGIEVEGGQLVAAAGAPPRPILRLRCCRSGQRMTLVHIPEGHSHFWQTKTLPDGREYLEAHTADGLRLIGWRGAGGVYVCLAPREVQDGALAAMAAAVRDASG